MHEPVAVHDSVPLSAFSSGVRISVAKPRIRDLELRTDLVLTSSLIFLLNTLILISCLIN